MQLMELCGNGDGIFRAHSYGLNIGIQWDSHQYWGHWYIYNYNYIYIYITTNVVSYNYYIYIHTSIISNMMTGWWFGTWLLVFHILGIKSSQLTNSFFQRGRYTTNQIIYIYITTSMMMGTLAISFSRRKSINIHGPNHNNNRDLINLIFGCDVIFDIWYLISNH